MTNTYYTSLSGMLAASYGLQNTSNNVANMQSPGFKRNDVFYSSLGNGTGEEGLGAGVRIGGNATNFSDGNYLETSNPSDLAIVGQGFFVVRVKNGELLYTRDGEFGFNNDGILIDRHSGGEVQGYNSAGNLVPIHEKGPKNSPGKASRDIFLNGQFILREKATKDDTNPVPDIPDTIPGQIPSKYENVKFDVKTVYDAQGKAHQVELEFRAAPEPGSPDDGLRWELVKVTCDNADVRCIGTGIIVFNGSDQGAREDACSLHLLLNNKQSVNLNFGDYRDSADQSVQAKPFAQNPEGTKIDIWQNDGYAEGTQISFSFDENGQISYNYDNGQSIQGIYVGLARFDDLEHNLVQTQDNLFRAKSDSGLHLGRANQDGFGSIKSRQLESSNVDSTTEFANIVILQRMFQACSQIMDIDKQLLEGLEST